MSVNFPLLFILLISFFVFESVFFPVVVFSIALYLLLGPAASLLSYRDFFIIISIFLSIPCGVLLASLILQKYCDIPLPSSKLALFYVTLVVGLVIESEPLTGFFDLFASSVQAVLSQPTVKVISLIISQVIFVVTAVCFTFTIILLAIEIPFRWAVSEGSFEKAFPIEVFRLLILLFLVAISGRLVTDLFLQELKVTAFIAGGI